MTFWLHSRSHCQDMDTSLMPKSERTVREDILREQPTVVLRTKPSDLDCGWRGDPQNCWWRRSNQKICSAHHLQFWASDAQQMEAALGIGCPPGYHLHLGLPRDGLSCSGTAHKSGPDKFARYSQVDSSHSLPTVQAVALSSRHGPVLGAPIVAIFDVGTVQMTASPGTVADHSLNIAISAWMSRMETIWEAQTYRVKGISLPLSHEL